MIENRCFYCNIEHATILKPIPIIQETFFKRMAYRWVCQDCNKIHCEFLGDLNE